MLKFATTLGLMKGTHAFLLHGLFEFLGMYVDGNCSYYSSFSVSKSCLIYYYVYNRGTWWRIVRVEAFRPEGRGLESRSSRYEGTLGKSITHSCLWRFGVKLRHSIRSVSGALLGSSGLKRRL